MSLLFSSWSPDFLVATVAGILSLLAGGIFLAGACWLVGYVVHHLIALVKGGIR